MLEQEASVHSELDITAGDIIGDEVDASAMPAEASVLGGGLTLTETVKGAASLTARFALYPSILYNLARNRLQDNWHWWDKITEVYFCLPPPTGPRDAQTHGYIQSPV